jgi:DNA-directed RNA polymerase subunit F
MYLIVEFREKGKRTVSIIAENWQHATKCALWPPYKSDKAIDKAAKEMEVPGDLWTAYPIAKIMYKTCKFLKIKYSLCFHDIDV